MCKLFLTLSVRRLLLCVTSRYCFVFVCVFVLPSAGILLHVFLYSLVTVLCEPLCWLLLLGDLGGAVEGRSGEAVHITMMLQVVEQEEVQQVQIVALLGRVVLPVDRRGR